MTRTAGKGMIWLIIILAVVFYIIFGGRDEDQEMLTESEIEEIVETEVYSVAINNISESQPLSPGVFVVHNGDLSLNFEDQISPEELEPLAEYGEPIEFFELVKTLPGAMNVYLIENPIMPGESHQFEIELPVSEAQLYISGVTMAVASNDGFALLDSVLLDGEAKTVQAKNYDNGTEENSDLESGFEGGQPDGSRGSENILNGTATEPQTKVIRHVQLNNSVMEVLMSLN